MLTTDMLARGWDVPDITLVVNYDMPYMDPRGGSDFKLVAESYQHRIGRTGRYL